MDTRLKKPLYSAVYLGVIGLLSNAVARHIPRRFAPDKPPFGPLPFEKNGQLYEKAGIRKWKDKVPDVSRVLKFMTPKKLVPGDLGTEAENLVQETCVAELVHWTLWALSLPVLLFWRSFGGAVFVSVYNLLGNLPFIMIQRYNRPRLAHLARRRKKDNA